MPIGQRSTTQIGEGIRAIKSFFWELDSSLENLKRTVEAIVKVGPKVAGVHPIRLAQAAGVVRSVRPPSPKLKRIWERQGQYMGLFKALSNEHQKMVKGHRERKGIMAAISLAKQYRGRKGGKRGKGK